MTQKFNWINWDRNRPVTLNGLLQWNNNSHLQSQSSEVFKNKDCSLKISQYSQENTNTSIFLRILQIFKNSYFDEHVRTVASALISNDINKISFFRQGVFLSLFMYYLMT